MGSPCVAYHTNIFHNSSVTSSESLEFERFRCRRFVTLGEFFVVTDPGGGEEDTFLADDDGEGIWAIRNFGDDVEFFVAGVDF